MRCWGKWTRAFLSIAMAAGCGGDAYSFGEHDDQIDRIEPSLTAYCTNAIDCVPRWYEGSVESCRFQWLLVAVLDAPTSQPICEEAFLGFFECGATASCPEFPLEISSSPLDSAAGNDVCADEALAVRAACFSDKTFLQRENR